MTMYKTVKTIAASVPFFLFASTWTSWVTMSVTEQKIVSALSLVVMLAGWMLSERKRKAAIAAEKAKKVSKATFTKSGKRRRRRKGGARK